MIMRFVLKRKSQEHLKRDAKFQIRSIKNHFVPYHLLHNTRAEGIAAGSARARVTIAAINEPTTPTPDST